MTLSFASLRRSQTRLTLAALALGFAALTLAASAANAAPRVIAIKGTDDMKYSVPKIMAKPGEELTITLSTVSSQPKTAMAHNFILLAPGTEVTKFINAAAIARKTEHIPAAFAANILAKTGLAGNKETVKVTFKAPTKPGTYTFVCSFPGHYTGGMKGELIVK